MTTVETDDLEETFQLDGPPPRYVHILRPDDNTVTLCGVKRPASAPTFRASRHWVDCPVCLKKVGA